MSSNSPSDEYAKEAIEPLISPLILSGESEENGSAPLQEEQMEIVTPEWAIRPSTSSVSIQDIFEDTSADNLLPTTFESQYLSSQDTIQPSYQLMDCASNQMTHTTGQYGSSAYDQPTDSTDDYTTSNLNRAMKFTSVFHKMRDYQPGRSPSAQSEEPFQQLAGGSSSFESYYHQTGYIGPIGSPFGSGLVDFGSLRYYPGAGDSTTSIYSVGGLNSQRADYLLQPPSNTTSSAQPEGPSRQLPVELSGYGGAFESYYHETVYLRPNSSSAPTAQPYFEGGLFDFENLESGPTASDSATSIYSVGGLSGQRTDYLLEPRFNTTSSAQAERPSEHLPDGSGDFEHTTESYYHQTGYTEANDSPFGDNLFDFGSLEYYPDLSDSTTSMCCVDGFEAQKAGYLLQTHSNTTSALENDEQFMEPLTQPEDVISCLWDSPSSFLQHSNIAQAIPSDKREMLEIVAEKMEEVTAKRSEEERKLSAPTPGGDEDSNIAKEQRHYTLSLSASSTCSVYSSCRSQSFPDITSEDGNIIRGTPDVDLLISPEHYAAVQKAKQIRLQNSTTLSDDKLEEFRHMSSWMSQKRISTSDEDVSSKAGEVEASFKSDDAIASSSFVTAEGLNEESTDCSSGNKNIIPPTPKSGLNCYDPQMFTVEVHPGDGRFHDDSWKTYNFANFTEIGMVNWRLFKGKTAKPGWITGSTFFQSSWEHDALHSQRVKPLIYKLQKIGIEGFNYIKTTEISLKIFQEESVVSVIDGVPACHLKYSYSYLKRQIVASTEFALSNINDKQAAYFRDIWKLCWALFGPSHDSQWNRKCEFDKWLKDMIAPIIECEESATQHVLDVIYLNLTGRRVKQAAELVAKSKYPNLSLLISSFTTEKQSQLVKQIEDWKHSGAIKFIDEKVLRVYLLLSGCPVFEDLNICSDLDWLRAFAVHMWYMTSISEPLGVTVNLYEKAFRQLGYAPTPTPPHYTDSSENAPLDIMYQLIILFTNKQYKLNRVLNPTTYTNEINDYSLSWFLVQYFQKIHVGIITNTAEDYISINFAEQLERRYLWHLSIFVLLFIKNGSTKKKLIMEILYRNVTNDIFEPKNETIKHYLTQDLQLPLDWIHTVLAEKCKSEDDYSGAYHHYLYSNQFNEAEAIALKYLIPNLIRNHDYNCAIDFMRKLEPYASKINNWNHKLGLLLDILIILDVVTKNRNAPATLLRQFYDRLLVLCHRIVDFEIQNLTQKFCIAELSRFCALELIFLTEKLSATGEMDKLYLMQIINEILQMPPDYKAELMERLMRDVSVCAKRRRGNEE